MAGRAAEYAAYAANVKRRRRRAGSGWFNAGDWSVADAGTGGDIVITINFATGGVVTDIEYDVDGDENWTTIGGAAVGDYPLAGFADDVEIAIRLRSVDADGNGLPSYPKTVVPTA